MTLRRGVFAEIVLICANRFSSFEPPKRARGHNHLRCGPDAVHELRSRSPGAKEILWAVWSGSSAALSGLRRGKPGRKQVLR